MDFNLTAFDFTIDFSKPLSEKRRMHHFGSQSNSLSNIPSVHHRFFSKSETKASTVVMHLSELPQVSKDIKQCLGQMEKCRRALSGLLILMPTGDLTGHQL